MTTKRIVAELHGKVLPTYHLEAATLKAADHIVSLTQRLEGKRLIVDFTCSCGDDCRLGAKGFAQVYAAGLRAGLRSAGLLAEVA